MTRWVDLAYAVQPVESHSVERAEVLPPEPTPTPGRCWGRPSAFTHSREALEEDGGPPSVTVNWPTEGARHFMRVLPAELEVVAKRVKVEEGEVVIEIDRLERMMFRYTEPRPKPTVRSLQPTRTTYYDMTFELHPIGETEAL